MREELPAAEMQMTQHDQVGQVGAGQQQRTGVGEEQASIQQRRLTLVSTPGRVHQHRSEKRDRSVEIQHGRHCTDHHGGADEEHPATPCRTGEPMTGS